MSKITSLPDRRAALPRPFPEGDRCYPRLISYEETAHRLGGVTIRHVENLVARGELVRRGRGKARGIVESSLNRYIEGEDNHA